MTTDFRQSAPDEALCRTVMQARATLGVGALTHLACWEISGEDATRFLQNRLSNDVSALRLGQGQLNAALDRHGGIQGVFSLHCGPEPARFWMVIDSAEASHCVAQILQFRIMERIEIVPSVRNTAFYSLQGPRSIDFLSGRLQDAALPEQEFAWCEGMLFGIPVRVIRRSFSGDPGFILMLSSSNTGPEVDEESYGGSELGALPDSFWKSLRQAVEDDNGVLLTPDAQEVLRVEAGIPRFGADYEFGVLLPETGLERQAVSYSKGCYLGQETIARVKTYGSVQKALTGLLFLPDCPWASLPPPDSDCFLDGKKVGILKSRAYSPTLQRPIAMAYLGRTERVPGRTLRLEIDGRPFTVEVALLPFHQPEKSAREHLDEGLRQFSEGFDEEAIRSLREAIRRDPSLESAYEALGVILSRHERFDEAIKMMETLLTLDPDHVLAHTNLSIFYMKLGDREKAEEEKAKATMAAFRRQGKAAGLVPDLEAERQRKERAALEKIEMFQAALAMSPDDPLGNFGLGSTLLELKRYAEAIAPLEKTIRAQPRHSVAYLSLGKALEGLSEQARAAETYRRGIEIAAAKGDLMPLKEMQARLSALTGE